MTEEQRRDLYYIERRLQQLERWRRAVATKQGALDEETRLRLERKIDGERSALHKRLGSLRRGRALPADQTAARHAAASASATEAPSPNVPAATALRSKARAASDLVAGDSGQPRQGTQEDLRGGAPMYVQRRSKRRTGRRRVLPIAASAAVLLIVVAGYFGSRQLDRQAEVFLDSQLTEMIEESGLEELISYSRVEVNSLRGRVRFFDVAFTSANPHSRLEAVELRAQMAPDDLVRLARDRETAELSGLRVSLFGGAAADDGRGTELEFSEISAGFTGHLPLETIDRPETVRFSEIDFLLEGMSFSDSESGVNGTIDEAGYTVTGEFTVADLDRNPEELLQRLEAIETRVAGVRIGLSGTAAQELEEFRMMLGEYGWLAELENWAVEDGSLRMTFEPQTLSVESLRFVSLLLNMEGSLRIALDAEFDPAAARGELRVNEVHDDIRAVSRLYLGLSGTGYSIPSEGPFTVSFEVDEHSDPRIDIR